MAAKWRRAEKWSLGITVVGLVVGAAWAIFIYFKPSPTPVTANPSVEKVVQGTGGITQIGNRNQVVVTPPPALSQPEQPSSQQKPESEAKPNLPVPESASGPSARSIQPVANQTGSATTSGPNSPAVTGGTNTFNYGTDKPKPEDKQ
jgi:hypothetical protein